MTENYHKWFSQYTNREFEIVVFGTSGIPVIFFPPAKDRFFTAKDKSLIHSVAGYIDKGLIKVYCPDTYDNESWYNFSADPGERIKEYLNFEALIIHDLIGFAKYETSQERVIMAGAGFGGYHAVNFTLKHPDMVSGLISMSGFYDIKQFIYGFYNNDCYFNNPPDYLPGLKDQWYLEHLKRIKILLGCSLYDLCMKENQDLSQILESKGIKNTLQIKESGYEWDLWKNFFPNFLARILNGSAQPIDNTFG